MDLILRMLQAIGHRRVIALSTAGILLGPLAAGLTATGLSIFLAGPVSGLGLLGLAWLLARRLPSDWEKSRVPIVWLVAMGITCLVVARVSVFAYDASRDGWSVLPASGLRWHSCFTALTGALDQLRNGWNIYDEPASSVRVAGRFDADPFFYAPSFLLLPVAISSVLQTQDFLLLRSAWFAFQVLTLMSAVLMLAGYVGGRPGKGLLLSLPLIWLAPPVLMNLQIGNFQVSAIAFAAAGMVLLGGGHLIAGGALLATAVTSKLFPGVLLVYLLVSRRLAAVAWTAAWGIGLAVLFLLMYGVQPFRDYLAALPGIQAGTVGITAILTQNPADNVANLSYYGLTRKLVALGVPLSPAFERMAQTAAGLLVLGVAGLAAWRRRGPVEQSDRWNEAIVWVALLNLASFRSPFLPDLYAYPGVYLLMALLVAAMPRVNVRTVLLVGLAWVLLTPLDALLTLAFLPGRSDILLTLLVQVAVIAMNLACALDRRFPDRLQNWLLGQRPA